MHGRFSFHPFVDAPRKGRRLERSYSAIILAVNFTPLGSGMRKHPRLADL